MPQFKRHRAPGLRHLYLRGPAAVLFGPRAEDAGRSPISDFWYGPVSPPSATGLRVDANSALKVSAVRACVSLISEAIASTSLKTYRLRPDGGKEEATDLPLYKTLHDEPNDFQSSGEFIELLQAQALLTGDGYANIVPGPSGSLQLIPIRPQDIRIERIGGYETTMASSWRYQVRGPNGQERPYNREDIFHLPGFSMDGVRGLPITTSAKEAIGLALAAERYGALYFGQGSKPSGYLKTEGTPDPEDAKLLVADWQAANAGMNNMHKVALLSDGVEWVETSKDNSAAQYLELRIFEVEEIARSFRVPLHMISSTDKSTTWGTGIAQMSLGFVTYTLFRHIRRWEQAIQRQLITRPGVFAEFNLDSLLRGDPNTRRTFYATARQWGWLSVNDVRRLENMNPIEGGDIYLSPLNMGQTEKIADATGGEPAPPEPPEQSDPNGFGGQRFVDARSHARMLEAAGAR